MIHQDLLWAIGRPYSSQISRGVRKGLNDLISVDDKNSLASRYLRVDKKTVTALISMGVPRPMAIYIATCDLPGTIYRIRCLEIRPKQANQEEIIGPFEDLRKAITSYKANKWLDALDGDGRRLMSIERSCDQGISWPETVYQDDDSK